MSTPPVMQIIPPYTPELLSSVQNEITNFMKGKRVVKVLEIGSGWSTIWFGLMNPQPMILSLEHDEDWAREVGRVFEEKVLRLSPVVLLRANLFSSMMSQLRNKYYDVIYIDGYDDVRTACTIASLPLLRDDGLLILDDTHWDLWKECLSYVRSFDLSEVTVSGDHIRKDGSKQYHQTTLFYRSQDDRL